MDHDDIKAAWAEAHANLARLADMQVEHREHRDDGHSSDWAKGMPPKPAPPTMAEVEAKIADALAAQPRALTAEEVEKLVDRMLGTHSVLTPKAIAPILDELRRQVRAEIVEQIGLLRADVGERGNDRVVDLPILPLRGRHG